MVSEELKLEHIIRGHHGLLRFDKKGLEITGYPWAGATGARGDTTGSCEILAGGVYAPAPGFRFRGVLGG